MAQAVSSDLLSGLLYIYEWWTTLILTLLRHRETPGDDQSIYLVGGSMEVSPWGFDVEVDTWHFYRRWLSEGGASRRAQHGSGPSSEGEILRGTVKGRGAQWSWFSCSNAAVLNQEWLQPPRAMRQCHTLGDGCFKHKPRNMAGVKSTAPVNKAFSHPKCQ